MKLGMTLWLVALSVLTTTIAWGCGPCMDDPEALERLLESRRELLQRMGDDPDQRAEELAALEQEIDRVAGAKDASYSGLYWYRDLEHAKRVAQELGRPILSLRLLGELTCDESCANSRFFRTVLYANTELAAWLGEHYVLHWQTVRDVPVITIDFGDGRVMRRTVAGNSIHYVLDPQGQVVDALPGLYGPTRFQRHLSAALDVVRGGLGAPERASEYWRRHVAVSRSGLERELAEGLVEVGDPRGKVWDSSAEWGRDPSAAEAAPRAMGKMLVEAPLVAAVTLESPVPGDPVWAALAAREAPAAEARLDDNSRALMRAKLEAARRDGAAFAAVVREFEQVVARDMLQNDLLLRPLILARLSEGARDPEALNTWVYAKVFLTPDHDPWLGLESGAYTGLTDGGLTAPETP